LRRDPCQDEALGLVRIGGLDALFPTFRNSGRGGLAGCPFDGLTDHLPGLDVGGRERGLIATRCDRGNRQ
ncbi:MAG: hypothetical protein ACKOCX_09655, partial [Planctomycetota bacterium]